MKQVVYTKVKESVHPPTGLKHTPIVHGGPPTLILTGVNEEGKWQEKAFYHEDAQFLQHFKDYLLQNTEKPGFLDASQVNGLKQLIQTRPFSSTSQISQERFKKYISTLENRLKDDFLVNVQDWDKEIIGFHAHVIRDENLEHHKFTSQLPVIDVPDDAPAC